MMKNINEKNNLHVFRFASVLGLFYRMIQQLCSLPDPFKVLCFETTELRDGNLS